MKFGGSSVADRARLAHVAELVAKQPGPVLVVVSALGETTDELLSAGEAAERGDAQAVARALELLGALHEGACEEPETRAEVGRLLAELASVLEGVRLLREQSPRTRALLSSFGERLSAPLLAAHLRARGRGAEAVDARSCVVTTEDYLGAEVLLGPTRAAARSRLRPLLERGLVPVVTGFIGATAAGVTTTLGRGGSDYSATLLANLLEASEVWIWTDVPGILTADPRLVKEARTLPQVSYREAAEMSYFGARVLAPRTILPAMQAGIPVRILSTFAPSEPGTVVGPTSPDAPAGVKTVTSIHDLALVTLDGRGMAGVPGVARRIFEASEAVSVNVVMISQASSEQTVSLVVPAADCERLERAIAQRFAAELASGAVERVVVDRPVAVTSVIGQGMAGTPGVSGKLFSALGNVGVNVLAIAQGASELSISVAVREPDAVRAVRAAHTAFGLTRVANLVVLGAGRVGRTFLGLLTETRRSLEAELGLELRLVGLASSGRWVVDHQGLDPAVAVTSLAQGESRPTDEELLAAIVSGRCTDVILVDLTAADTTELHARALSAGLHVVTANKLPLAGPLSAYRRLMGAARQAGVRYGYETTFGAGLPVLHTLQELVHTGDSLLSISGCLSGTLGFLCSRLQEGSRLVDAVESAREGGYTEPDPREDLSGRDVARKALIIARAAGILLEPEQVQLEPLVPGLEGGLSPALGRHAPHLAARVEEAAARGEVLRYVAAIGADGATVGLRNVPALGPLGQLQGPDNLLVFRTRRYDAHPLIIRGPGAGAEVTAAGVLGDVLKIARR